MILVLEVAFLVAGVYAIFTAKIPTWMVGKGYKAEGNSARLLGVLMAALLPGLFCAGVTVGIIAGVNDFDSTLLVSGIEIGSVILVAIIVTVVIRRIRQPDVPAQQIPPSPFDQKLE